MLPVEYSNIPSAIRLVPHGDNLSVPQPPEGYRLQVTTLTSQDPDFVT